MIVRSTGDCTTTENDEGEGVEESETSRQVTALLSLQSIQTTLPNRPRDECGSL